MHRMSPEIFAPFYRDLEQFETNHYGDIDETYIGLLSLIPANEEMINLTLTRLFSCENITCILTANLYNFD